MGKKMSNLGSLGSIVRKLFFKIDWQVQKINGLQFSENCCDMLPSACGRVHCLGKWGQYDIIDPFQKPLADFERTLHLIEQATRDWVYLWDPSIKN